MERFDDVFLTLSGNARDRLAASIVIAMTRSAPSIGRRFLANLGQLGMVIRRLRGGRLRRLERGKISAEVANVLIAELLGDRRHALILPRAAAEEDQLPLQKLIRLRC